MLRALRHRLHRLALLVYAQSPAFIRRRVVRLLSPLYVVGVVCLVRDGDDVLLLRQRHDPTDWSLPGGLLKRGETPLEGLTRELREELGISLKLDDQPTLVNVVPELRRADLVYEVHVQQRPQVRIDDVEVLAVEWRPIDVPVENEVTAAVLRLVRDRSS